MTANFPFSQFLIGHVYYFVILHVAIQCKVVNHFYVLCPKKYLYSCAGLHGMVILSLYEMQKIPLHDMSTNQGHLNIRIIQLTPRNVHDHFGWARSPRVAILWAKNAQMSGLITSVFTNQDHFYTPNILRSALLGFTGLRRSALLNRTMMQKLLNLNFQPSSS